MILEYAKTFVSLPTIDVLGTNTVHLYLKSDVKKT